MLYSPQSWRGKHKGERDRAVGRGDTGGRGPGVPSSHTGTSGCVHSANTEREPKCDVRDFKWFYSRLVRHVPGVPPAKVTSSVQGPGLPHWQSLMGSRVGASGLAVQPSSHWPLVATEHLKCGWSKMRCPLSIIEGLIWKKKKSISIILMLITCWSYTVWEIIGKIKFINELN